jgi:hypothetical protein
VILILASTNIADEFSMGTGNDSVFCGVLHPLANVVGAGLIVPNCRSFLRLKVNIVEEHALPLPAVCAFRDADGQMSYAGTRLALGKEKRK